MLINLYKQVLGLFVNIIWYQKKKKKKKKLALLAFYHECQ